MRFERNGWWECRRGWGATGELKMMIYNKMTGTIKLKSTTDKSTYCAACQVQVCFEPLFTSIPAVPTFPRIKKNKKQRLAQRLVATTGVVMINVKL